MSDEENESGSFPTSTAPDQAPENEAGQSKRHHKVIADIHSGMVLVAPVATALDEENVPADPDAQRPDTLDPDEVD